MLYGTDKEGYFTILYVLYVRYLRSRVFFLYFMYASKLYYIQTLRTYYAYKIKEYLHANENSSAFNFLLYVTNKFNLKICIIFGFILLKDCTLICRCRWWIRTNRPGKIRYLSKLEDSYTEI